MWGSSSKNKLNKSIKQQQQKRQRPTVTAQGSATPQPKSLRPKSNFRPTQKISREAVRTKNTSKYSSEPRIKRDFLTVKNPPPLPQPQLPQLSPQIQQTTENASGQISKHTIPVQTQRTNRSVSPTKRSISPRNRSIRPTSRSPTRKFIPKSTRGRPSRVPNKKLW